VNKTLDSGIRVADRGRNPFDRSGTVLGDDGITRYTGLPTSLVKMLQDRAAACPDTDAVIELDGPTLTYRELMERSARFAGGLRARGIGDGDRVAILLPSGVDWVLAFLGTMMAGAIPVPVNTRLSPGEVDQVVGDAQATLRMEPGAPLPDADPVVPAQPAHRDIATIFYTSGTTGEPKGAMQTHEGLLTNAENAARSFPLDRELGPGELRTLIAIPLFHVTGCHTQLLTTLYLGGTSVIMPVLDVGRLLQVIGDERINYLIGVPAIFKLAIMRPEFATTDVSGVRWVGYGGAPSSPTLIREIQQAFANARTYNGFGSTESSSLTSALPHEFSTSHIESVGFAMPVVDLALFEPDPATGVGELLVRAPNVVPGYWGKPERTAETIVNGWLHTGDLARIEDGLIYLADRARDVINRGGEKVYSVEIEAVLASLDGVAESAVVGVTDDVMGEKVGALVVTTPGAVVTPDAVAAHVASRLADFKVPEYVVVQTDPLPRNPGGKLRKASIRADTKWGSPLR
jgi:acyl-CoA synthetase (AMP-forming)/AMP-acid ligase II